MVLRPVIDNDIFEVLLLKRWWTKHGFPLDCLRCIQAWVQSYTHFVDRSSPTTSKLPRNIYACPLLWASNVLLDTFQALVINTTAHTNTVHILSCRSWCTTCFQTGKEVTLLYSNVRLYISGETKVELSINAVVCNVLYGYWKPTRIHIQVC